MIKQPWEIAAMRTSCKKLAEVIRIVRDSLEEGISLNEINDIAKREMLKRKCIPAFEGYTFEGKPPFKGVTCLSVNEVVIHGEPSDRILMNGDIISCDFGVSYGGYFADSAFTAIIGEPLNIQLSLLEATRFALDKIIKDLGPGVDTTYPAKVIKEVCDDYGFHAIKDYGGHGIGRALHEAPFIPNVSTPLHETHKFELKPGMTVAIEPMIGMGTGDTIEPDAWTVSTKDGSLAAHFEHTILITDNGCEVLTRGGWDD